MSEALKILKQYWNHLVFREPQNEIIEAVLSGRDTFALMPTGGGKSICFQIPAMLMPGICLVISPLVALMKDQVSNLQKRGIKAMALVGGIRQDDLIDLFDNAQFGDFKFLYLSPERLQSEWIVERLKNLPINLIAIDEAHCVSQWGHDFRPAYLKISGLRNHFPKVSFLALTASATPRVREDIVAQLHLKDPAVFTKSFARENLAYMVFEAEDKLYRIGQILRKYPGPSIIYVRNRKSSLEVSTQLNIMGFKSIFYHGGLSSKEKDRNMALWMEENAQVMVATNAFGMGIDKENVRTVIHIQLPENLENYYQEAGRAGRNGEKAFAVLLHAPSDNLQAQNQFLESLPDRKFLLELFIKLCSYFQIAYGEGIEEQFSLNLNQFCLRYKFPTLKAYNALQFLDRQGILTLSQEFSEKIMMQFLIESKEVIRYMSLNPAEEPVILAIVRTYPGIYEMPTAFNLPLISKKSGHQEQEVQNILEKLAQKQVIAYHARNNDTTIVFHEIREDEKTINRVGRYLENQNKLKTEQLQAVIQYVATQDCCRSKLLLAYFGEKDTAACGICTYCISRMQKTDSVFISKSILELLQNSELDSRELGQRLEIEPAALIFALQSLLESEAIILKPNNHYALL